MLWFKLLCVLLALYLGVFLALVIFQSSFMYHPNRGSRSEYLARAKKLGLQPWRDANGVLIGWHRATQSASPAKNRMLILHGNGGDALSRVEFLDGFGGLNNGRDWEFYILEYPGYGWRTEPSTENNLLAAGDDAIATLIRDDKRPLFLTGESLGTGIASILASRHPQQVAGLFLVTPYTSTVDVAAGRFPMFPVRSVMRDRYESAKALTKYSGPLAVLVAGQDKIVPTHFGQKLYDDYRGPKRLWIQPDAGHNTLDYAPGQKWWRDVSDFLTNRGSAGAPPAKSN